MQSLLVIYLSIAQVLQLLIPLFLRSIPVAWRSDFVAESKDAESKMASLKSRLRASEVKVTEK